MVSKSQERVESAAAALRAEEAAHHLQLGQEQGKKEASRLLARDTAAQLSAQRRELEAAHEVELQRVKAEAAKLFAELSAPSSPLGAFEDNR